MAQIRERAAFDVAIAAVLQQALDCAKTLRMPRGKQEEQARYRSAELAIGPQQDFLFWVMGACADEEWAIG